MVDTVVPAQPVIRQLGDKMYLVVNSYSVQLHTMQDVIAACTLGSSGALGASGSSPTAATSNSVCGHPGRDGAHCIKPEGHAKKHYYHKKVFKPRGHGQRLVETFEKGASNYDARNWGKAAPVSEATESMTQAEQRRHATSVAVAVMKARMSQGLCCYCSTPSVRGKKQCAKHLAISRKNVQRLHAQQAKQVGKEADK